MPVEDAEWDEHAETPPTESAKLEPTSPGPEVESDEDSLSEEPHPGSQLEMSDTEAPTPDPLPEFDEKVRDDFEGLLYLGRLTSTFTWLGHEFTIRSLTSGEIIEIGLLHKRYVGTLADVKAYQALVVAASVVEVDGKAMPTPLTNEPKDTALLNRFRYVMRSWFPPTLDAVYEQFLLLERRVSEVIKAMGESQG